MNSSTECIKLNLGGGSLPIKGFLNVDLAPNADVIHDLRQPLPFKDKSVSEIMALHVIESFNRWEIDGILKDWRRVLDGRMTIEFTSLSDTIALYNSPDSRFKQWGHWGLYGNQSVPIDPIVLHHYVYEREELQEILEKCGFKVIEFTREGVAHVPERDLRVICE